MPANLAWARGAEVYKPSRKSAIKQNLTLDDKMRETYTMSTHGLLAVMLHMLNYRRGTGRENIRLVLVAWIIYKLPHTVSEQLDQILNMELPDACACAFRTLG